MHTHVIHFLRHSGTATSQHSRPGHCGPFLYHATLGNSGRFWRLQAPRRTSPSSRLRGRQNRTPRRHCRKHLTVRVPRFWAFSFPGFPGVLGISSRRPHSASPAKGRPCRRGVSSILRAHAHSTHWVVPWAGRWHRLPWPPTWTLAWQENAGRVPRGPGREGRGSPQPDRPCPWPGVRARQGSSCAFPRGS